MYIAPSVHKDEWFKLNLDDDSGPDWNKAIKILEFRIKARYLEPVDLLIEEDDKRPAVERRYGFTILAIDCLLMETLQAFKDGLTDTKGKSKPTFKKFLKESPSFSPYFPDDKSAQSFYEDYRCGILHQAEVMGTSLVWSVGKLRGKVGDKWYINRTEIHDKLKKDFYQYLELLRDKNNKKLRDNFRNKMNFIARKAAEEVNA